MYDAINHAALGALTERRLPEYFKDAAARPAAGPGRPRSTAAAPASSSAATPSACRTSTAPPPRTSRSARATPAPRTGCSSPTCCATSARRGPRSSSARRGQHRDGPRAAARRAYTARGGRGADRAGVPSASPRRAQRLLRRARRLPRGHQRRPAARCARRVGSSARTARSSTPRCRSDAAEPLATRADVVYIASLVGGIFGKGGGGEVANARWLQQLQAQFGPRRRAGSSRTCARATTRRRRRRRAPRFPYEGEPVDPTLPGVGPARPRRRRPRPAPAPTPAGRSCRSRCRLRCRPPAERRRASSTGPFGPIDLGAVPDGHEQRRCSSAPTASATGHPRSSSARRPATSRRSCSPRSRCAARASPPAASPSPARSSSSSSATASTTPGRPPAPPATSSTPSPSGSATPTAATATVESTAYLVGGTCTPIDSYVHEETALPTPAAPGAAADRPLPGAAHPARHRAACAPRSTARPSRVVTQRVDLRPGARLRRRLRADQRPRLRAGRRDFARAFDGVDYTFNWFYVDDRDIAYYCSRPAAAARGRASTRTCRAGATPRYDWQGFLPVDDHPQQTNPPSGYLSRWNNKQAPGFSAADNQWGYGPVYRSLRSTDRMADAGRRRRGDDDGPGRRRAGRRHRRPPRRLTLPPAARRRSATTPRSPTPSRCCAAGRSAAPTGVDRDRDGAYEEQAAIALFDELVGAGRRHRRASRRTVLRGTLGDLVDELPQRSTTTRGRAWARRGTASPGTATSQGPAPCVRRHGPGRRARRPTAAAARWRPAAPTCGRRCRRRSTGRSPSRASRRSAELTYDKHRTTSGRRPPGSSACAPIDWQNRPTFQQVVNYQDHRPR